MSQTQYSNEIHQPTPNDDGEIERAYSAWDQKFGARQISLGRDNADPFSTGRRLGSGGIGVVYETRLGSIPLAIKRTYARKLTRDQLNEIKILSKLSKQRHHHVVQLIGSYTQRQRAGYELSLVIWPVAHCDLSALLNDFGTLVDWNSRDVTRPILDDNAATDLLSSVEILSHLVDLKMPQNSREVSWLVEKTKHRLLECFGCIANAVAYLHLHGIRHKDLKPSQILLSPNGLWLADFGWSSDMSEFSQSVTSGGDRITMKYRAPERAGMEPCGRSEDVFAIGCIFLEISAYTTSYPTIQASDRPWAQEGWFFQANLEQIYSILKNRLRTSSFTYECAFSRLLGQMLAKDPQERPKTQAILDTLCQPPFKYFFGTEPTNSHVGRCCQTETQAIVTNQSQFNHTMAPFGNTMQIRDLRGVILNESKTIRRSRTGWGCGFCHYFTADWPEVSKHIGDHFTHDAKTVSDWSYNTAIHSLLNRPTLDLEWTWLVVKNASSSVEFEWNPATPSNLIPHDISRLTSQIEVLEDCIDSDGSMSLQDALETFSPDQDAAELANRAYTLATKTVLMQDATLGEPPMPRDSLWASYFKEPNWRVGFHRTT